MGFLTVGCHRRTILMPTVWLAGTSAITAKDLEHHIRSHRIGLLPAIRHSTGIGTVCINEDNETTSDAQETGIIAIVVADVGQIVGKLTNGGIPLTFRFIVKRPSEGC